MRNLSHWAIREILLAGFKVYSFFFFALLKGGWWWLGGDGALDLAMATPLLEALTRPLLRGMHGLCHIAVGALSCFILC